MQLQKHYATESEVPDIGPNLDALWYTLKFHFPSLYQFNNQNTK